MSAAAGEAAIIVTKGRRTDQLTKRRELSHFNFQQSSSAAEVVVG